MNSVFQAGTLESLRLEQSFLEELPQDPKQDNYLRQVKKACYSLVEPKKFPNAHLIAYSPEMAEELGLDPAQCETGRFTQVFSGNQLLDRMIPYAQCYGGHQFGHWAGQLGDGRAINLGEVLADSGRHWVLQLKGAGPTPYSRMADGLAVLRSSVREFLCSEAMHHLGVPTTRALSLIGTGDRVVRDMFYDGNPREEPGAVVCRVAPSFIRFGSFEIFTARKEYDVLKQLADYTIRKDFPHLGEPSPETYIQWFREVCRLTAEMIIHWMRVGFVHGVMNTDNMSVLGLTIDYGPYGWLEGYDPRWTPNTTDAHGRRYCFGAQPQIALWNLVQFANAIHPLIEQVEPLEEALGEYQKTYESGFMDMMASKLGLEKFNPETDEKLILDLFNVLQLTETDMTIFFRDLADVDPNEEASTAEAGLRPIFDAFYRNDFGENARDGLAGWLARYRERLQWETRPAEQKRAAMDAVNPRYVLRNYLAQQAIDKSEQGDHSMIHELMDVLRHPYDDQPGKEHLARKRPEWARHRAGCSMLSCSS